MHTTAIKIFIICMALSFTAGAQTSDTTKVHWFNTKAIADSSIAVINDGQGIPSSDSSTTTTYCKPYYDSTSQKWYIRADRVTQSYLGFPGILIKRKEQSIFK